MEPNQIQTDKNAILFIEDHSVMRNQLKLIFSPYYVCMEAVNGQEGLVQIEKHEGSICAILLDVFMPVMDGIELLRILHGRGITKKIPVFLLTSATDYEIVKEGYELGVMDVIAKPVAPFIILQRVQNIIELFEARENLSEKVRGQEKKLQENIEKIDAMHRNTIGALASAIEYRDVETGTHANRIYGVTKEILSQTDFGKDLSEKEIENIAVASIMHDVGKIAISDVVLNKPGKFTSDEFEVMKTHTTKGEEMMQQLFQMQNHESYEYARDIAKHHHERWDGRGYPDGLKGDEISVWAQVVSIADVYDALLSPRVYKRTYTPDEAVSMIVNGECGLFNPALVDSFLQVEPQIREWYKNSSKTNDDVQADAKNALMKAVLEESKTDEIMNREVVDVLLLMAAVQASYDMIISVNLTRNSYYMIDYDRFLTHVAEYEGVFDDLIDSGASAVPESHRELFIQTFSRDGLLHAYKKGKKSVTLEHPQHADDGVLHMVSTSVMFMEDPKTGDVLEITLSRYIDDEWEEKEKTKQILSDALVVAEQANKAKTDFLSRMSHDIRTPLNAIMGMTTIIEAHLDEPDRIKDCINKIGVASRHLLELINDILDFSKIESGTMSLHEADFGFDKLIEDVRVIMEPRALEKQQQFTIEVDEGVATSYVGEEFRIRQILLNLLDNAHKYTPKGGWFSLKVTANKSAPMHHFLTFTVEDNGIGISEKYLQEIFDPFTQCCGAVDSNGVGLGLAISRNLVHLMNGHMEVESVIGEGTCFKVEIPLAVSQVTYEKRMMADKENVQTSERIYGGAKVLVAEDNELNQEIVKAFLEMNHLTVDIAANGKEAVEKFERSAEGEYLVIFMDLSMPVMNGHEAAERIRTSVHTEAQTIPIYALTANAFYSDVSKAKQYGMNGHIAKPIDYNELQGAVEQALKERDHRRQSNR